MNFVINLYDNLVTQHSTSHFRHEEVEARKVTHCPGPYGFEVAESSMDGMGQSDVPAHALNHHAVNIWRKISPPVDVPFLDMQHILRMFDSSHRTPHSF